MGKSLGLIEVYGLASAIVIADAMAKVAAVQLLPIDYSAGAARVQIRVKGDVAAVQAAVTSGSYMAREQRCYLAHSVIARAANRVHEALSPSLKQEDDELENMPVVVTESEVVKDIHIDEVSINLEAEDISAEESSDAVEVIHAGATCNICADPACRREKGEPRNQCIHHNMH